MSVDQNSAWAKYQNDFNGMTDAEVDSEEDSSRAIVDEKEDWLEAVAAWKAAGKPRT
jgi:hypothetical protein